MGAAPGGKSFRGRAPTGGLRGIGGRFCKVCAGFGGRGGVALLLRSLVSRQGAWPEGGVGVVGVEGDLEDWVGGPLEDIEAGTAFISSNCKRFFKDEFGDFWLNSD